MAVVPLEHGDLVSGTGEHRAADRPAMLPPTMHTWDM
jgi:hypothetical protein